MENATFPYQYGNFKKSFLMCLISILKWKVFHTSMEVFHIRMENWFSIPVWKIFHLQMENETFPYPFGTYFSVCCNVVDSANLRMTF